ncbi:non-receptor tyrosine-protein kinase TYK2 [Periophthalmus magnuspinnatus]|uniref:non-receptor tyrosine-protein kinase TYK2 n=1 Tax=Periophthalmus magnuspinnatus TaxID=409849 RepID=UPI00145A55EB|nr:non-receptor tyrosine-protein kinase TYK2 [Periophthalmus magnuspinnatus]
MPHRKNCAVSSDMQFTMLRNRSSKKRSRSWPFPGECEPPQNPGVHVYLFWSPEGERYLSHTSGEVTAEELCISAAKAVGITPLCYMFYALYEPHSCCWYSPNHVFTLKENTPLVLYFRMRFYFHNWHGLNENEPKVSRYTPKFGTGQGCSPLFEISSLEYLFAQAKYEFVNEVIQIDDMRSEEELSRFKNESLGMAVLHLSHHALQTNKILQEVAEKNGFHHCIPRSFAKQISKDNLLTKYRMRRIFTNFVQAFQQDTVDKGKLGTQEIMYKYISTLEHLAPRFCTETYCVSHLDLHNDGQGCPYPNTNQDQSASKDNYKVLVPHEIMVCGLKGIQWREVSTQMAQSNLYIRSDYMRKAKQHSIEVNGNTPSAWNSFCDFPEITHIILTEDKVRISTEDNGCMEVHMSSRQEAESFVSLLDGYYRLTADAHHYLCCDVAPPRVVLSVNNTLHGPIQDEFVLMKLKKEAAEEGVFLVRWSVIDYHRLILAVLSKTENGSSPTHKQFRIEYNGSRFCLEGWDKEFSSMKELLNSLKTFILQSGSEIFMVKKCLPPKQRELSNLLVTRKTAERDRQHRNSSEVRFIQIKDKEIVKKKHLGQGTRTNIYSGALVPTNRANLKNDFNEIKVVLKILDNIHKNIALDFFGTASLMRQVSHSHLVFVHGVSVKGSENILVEEYVEFGPLDVFLRREKAQVSPQWKLLVAQQLASALSYLETKQLIHGNVCGKNILVARKGLETGTHPFVKLSDPGIALNVLSREERVERIPWIAPECIESGSFFGNAADQWSFGITLLEICNNGHLPMSSWTLSEKEQFYKQKGSLPQPSSEELTKFISMCLTYEPAERPSFRTVLRELTKIGDSEIILPDPMPQMDPTVYHKRYLTEMRELGAGHFGKVTLYLYDPCNDGTGEFVAVKALKQDGSQVPDGWIKEIETLKSLSHSNIVKYKGCCTELGGQMVQLVMEYVPMGSLHKYARERKLSMPQCLLFAQQICQGMAYLHSERYIHRDLAARNVLVENDNLVKIGDFGLSKYIPEGEVYYRVREDGDSPVYWYAIECLKESKFSFDSDIWSFGVTLYEILTRCDPRESPPSKFNEMKGAEHPQLTVMVLIQMLERQIRLPCPRDCPHEVKIIMDQCWATNRSDRPKFCSLINRFEDIRQRYDIWQSNANFSLAQIC